jgi:predicted patatin/cPLA2 family phospholipase
MSRVAAALLLPTTTVLLGLFAGCATAPQITPVPEKSVGRATLPGYAPIRYVHGYDEATFIADYQRAMRSAQPGPDGISLLAMSGGGPNGAFGAGVLVGWSELGTRPEFQIVTGVSTGALAAPFAFLGPAYNPRLIEAYTKFRDADLFRAHILGSAFRLLHVPSLADDHPLEKVLAQLVDAEVLNQIAVEYGRGRRLYVCTHELTSGRAVYWNLTALAASGRPDALDLFRQILVASASLPMVFPPQYFDVEVDGQRYTEVHLDGGLSRQAFLHLNGARAGLPKQADGSPVRLTAYVIRNGKLRPDYDAVPLHVLPIGMRTMQALVAAEGVGDLYRIYDQTLEEQADFRLILIPDDVPLKHHQMFEPEFMQGLYERGRQSIKQANPWHTRPPYLSPVDGT